MDFGSARLRTVPSGTRSIHNSPQAQSEKSVFSSPKEAARGALLPELTVRLTEADLDANPLVEQNTKSESRDRF